MASHTKASAAEKLIDLKVAAEEKLVKAGARMNEKVVLTKTTLAVGLHRIIHHDHNPRHDKCLDFAAETMTAATGNFSALASVSWLFDCVLRLSSWWTSVEGGNL